MSRSAFVAHRSARRTVWLRHVAAGALLLAERAGCDVRRKDRQRRRDVRPVQASRTTCSARRSSSGTRINELQLAEFDRWAVSPQTALVPWLARDVDRQLANAVVVAFPSVGHADAPFRVRGTISQWDTDAAGTAVLVVQWECVTDKGAVLVPLRTSRYTAQASKAGQLRRHRRCAESNARRVCERGRRGIVVGALVKPNVEGSDCSGTERDRLLWWVCCCRQRVETTA